MSLEALRSSALLTRHNEIREAQSAHLTLVHEFLRITNCIANNDRLSSLYNTNFSNPLETQDSEEVLSWLRDNSLENSRYLDETTLPTPNIPQDAAFISTSKPNRLTSAPPGKALAFPSVDTLAAEATIASRPLTPQSMAGPIVQQESTARSDLNQDDTPSNTDVSLPADSQSLLPEKVAPPEREEEANFSVATEELLDSETPQRPAKTLHLPPEKAQEDHMREREQETRLRSTTDQAHAALAKITPNRIQTQPDAPSSPSSTNGAQSAATPQPPQESPDTSPDTEHAPQILPPKDLRPSPEEQRQKEIHDRHLEAQKELAHKAALGDINETPDDQLKWEEKEAAARDAEEQTARESLNGPEPSLVDGLEKTEAEEAVEADVDLPTASGPASSGPVGQREKDACVADAPELSEPLTPATQALRRDAVISPTDENNIKTAHKRTFSEMTDSALPLSASLSRQQMLSEPVSPTRVRILPDGNAKDLAAVPYSPQRQAPQTPPHRRVSSDPYATLENVECLRGAAEDPERDYLEPLFKVQAYESQNIRTGLALSELVRSASKSLSTQDHFTSQHERLDYRMLRRIYQLQNANKWSLRQMQHVKEPQQPISHHDHLIAEMKWMRKDFRAEKKLKKEVCAFLANECARFVGASIEEKQSMQVRIAPHQERSEAHDDQMPGLDHADSPPEEDNMPTTPSRFEGIPTSIVVAPELSETVLQLRRKGQLGSTLKSLPFVSPWNLPSNTKELSHQMLPVSKFVEAKIRPLPSKAPRKRSRYDYEDDAKLMEKDKDMKRLCLGRDLLPEDQEMALFHPDNKHIRDRLHASSLFRPPSEFQMPSTSFYEFRQGSHWLIEDEQKLRRLAKQYAFNWSLIAEEMTLPSRFKSSFDRRTPWECFEHWVELESLPQEMRKTAYFKTWFQRLEQSAAASERRFQAQVAAMQQANNGAPQQTPMRRKTTPSRVDKRKNNRYLWLVDAMRKLARKREAAAYKQAEAQRAAASRKTVTDANQSNPPKLTPQQFSQKRYERDLQQREAIRARQQALLEARARQTQMARAAAAQQHGIVSGVPNQQQRPVNGMPQHHPQGQANGQIPAPSRQPLPMATRNGHLAVPQVGAQAIPQAQMRPNGAMQPPNMQRMAHPNGQMSNQQYGSQQYQMPNGNMASPGGSMTAQQHYQSNQALLSQYNSQQPQSNGGAQGQNVQNANSHQMSGSPNMPPPPTPHQTGVPQQLSSGHVPAVIAIKNSLRASNPSWTEEQLQQATNTRLQSQSQSQPQSQSTPQARQNAMNAAAGINGGAPAQSNGPNMPIYHQNQMAFHNSNNGNGNGTAMPNGASPYTNGDGSNNSAHKAPFNGGQNSPQHNYAQVMRQRQMQQMHMSHSMNGMAGGSPNMSHSSPNMQPASPNVQYANMNGIPQGVQGVNNNINGQQQRPPSRSQSGTPGQMQRIGSSGSVPGVSHTNGMQSPGALGQQGSPRTVQAGMAR